MRTLRYGDRGAEVTQLQQKLRAANCSPGAIDGQFGRRTLIAVKRFQSLHKLTVDGIVGAQTWTTLDHPEQINQPEQPNPFPPVTPVTPSPFPTQPPVEPPVPNPTPAPINPVTPVTPIAPARITTLDDILQHRVTLPLTDLSANATLTRQVQSQLQTLGMYSAPVDGIYGQLTQNALFELADTLNFNQIRDGKLDHSVAEKLLDPASVVPFILGKANDPEQVFLKFLNIQTNWFAQGQADDMHLAFLDRGVEATPTGSISSLPNRSIAASVFKSEIEHYPDRLATKPINAEVVSYRQVSTLANSTVRVRFSPYPVVGKTPAIDVVGLDFLPDPIEEACVCVGAYVDGQMMGHWSGKNALAPVQMWSITKLLPILHVVCRANQVDPHIDIDNCVVRDRQEIKRKRSFFDLIEKVVNYADSELTSNSLAAMFKQFETPLKLENWVKQITGNQNLKFQGRYGEWPYIEQPVLVDAVTRKVLLASANELHRGENLLSAYDMTRFISMLGWHHHILQAARLPGAQWHSLESVVRAMGTDTARYVDVAIATLGLQSVIAKPVIISKMGFGYSDQRQRTEAVYTALVQFVDQLPQSQTPTEPQPAKLRSVALTLRAAIDRSSPRQEAMEVDAQMAAAVTEILRRVVTEELI
ncbi:Peptidoglycan-binding domain 1 protein [Thalassoporum mexicanum PCC 7367]|uniref:peptidoglycan-binding domain-containing protein n=1 Tax=Thalassoporum mexicanum TaxID=3457544 RepID=UPI00029FF00D|nr:peptidoglycan-binding protein [Pseudanabaena sp. PCC 7367]AFY69403.1 Peptidoglycan-binding domain 1 protein [Pseudanabaena sp. PCC 7367]